MSEELPAGRKRKRGMLAVAAIAALGLVGGGAGMFAPRLMGAEAKATASGEAVGADLRNMDVGRIVVNIAPPDGAARHLVIQAILEYDASLLAGGDGHAAGGGHGKAEGGDSPEDILYRPKVRDAFIDYLANVSEPEIRGSSGMSMLRHELLRRARVAFGNDAPTALLIQDYVIQ